MEPGIAFGRALRRLRKVAGLTQEQLALEADVRRTFVSLMELGRNQPTITTIFKLAAALGCLPSQLVKAAEDESQTHGADE